MDNEQKLINELTPEAKETFKKRSKTSVYIVLFTIGVLIIGMLASCNSPIFRIHRNASLTFGCILVLLMSYINILAIKELVTCCLKSTNKILIFWFAVLSMSFSNVSILLMFPYLYGFCPDQFNNLRNASLIVLIIGGSLILLSCLILTFKFHTSTFNKFIFPTFVVLINVVFAGIYYILIVKFFTAMMFLLFIIYCTDTFAYVGGSLFGKHKMSPIISPKKTWEGLISSVIMGTGLSLGYLGLCSINHDVQYQIFGYHEYIRQLPEYTWWLIMALICFISTFINTAGDLTFSIIKRKNGIKDYSDVLPGHGGILDRMDSMSFVVFFYVAICFTCSMCSDVSLALFY